MHESYLVPDINITFYEKIGNLNTGYLILLRDYYILDVTLVLLVIIPCQTEQCDEILVDGML